MLIPSRFRQIRFGERYSVAKCGRNRRWVAWAALSRPIAGLCCPAFLPNIPNAQRA
jgi:hypothetical protein